MKGTIVKKCITLIILFIVSMVDISLLILSLMYAQWDEVKNEKYSIILLLAFYLVLLVLYVFCKSDKAGYKLRFKEISSNSFIIYCLFYPGAGVLLLFLLAKLIGWPSDDFIRYIIFVPHIFMIALWTGLKLKNHSELKESQLMKIDIISTGAVCLLTIVWILYKIEFIIWEFSLIMGEFLVIQMVIKNILVKRREKEEDNNML